MFRDGRAVSGAVVLGAVLALACGGNDGGSGTGPDKVLVVTPDTINLADCGSVQLLAQLQDGDGNPISGATFSFSSSAGGVVGVSGIGLVSAAGPGTATIVVGSAGLLQNIPVTITAVPAHFINLPVSVRLWPGVADTLSLGLADCHGGAATGAPPTIAIGDTAVAVVAGSVVTGSRFGTSTLTVTSDSLLSQVPIQVIGHPAGYTDITTGLVNAPYGVAVTKTGRVLVTQIGSSTLASGQLPGTTLTSAAITVGNTPPHVTVTPDGSTAFVTNQTDNSVSVVDLNTNLTVNTIPLAGNGFNLLATRDGGSVFVTTDIGRIYVIDVQTQAKVDSFTIGTASNGVAEDSARSLVYLSSRDGGTVTRYNTASATVVDTFVTMGRPQRMALSPNGNVLFIANEDLGLDIWNTQTGQRIVSVPMSAYGLGISPDGTQVYVAGADDSIKIIDAATHLILQTLHTGVVTRNVAFEANGRTAIVTDQGDMVHFIR